MKRGFTLLEVILALAILGLAMATLGQAVGRSHENARRAADESDLAVIAQTVLDEVLAGARPFAAVEGEGVADPLDPSAPAVAVVAVAIENSPFDGLLVVRVRARPNDASAGVLKTVEVVRWLVDPSLEASATDGEAAL